MSITTVLAIYFLVWWLTLFAVLPFGMSRQAEEGHDPGTDPGAPILTQMGRKLIWTTILSAIIFAIGMTAYHAGYLSIERLSKLMGTPF